MRDFLRVWLLVSVAWLVGCYPGGSVPTASSSTTTSGTGGGHVGPCGVDCSAFKTEPCTVAVCNTGQVPGNPIDTCIVIPAEDGTTCDDGKFCTVNDFCDKGVCIGGPQNNCGTSPGSCSSVICYEDTQSCSMTPADDGTACTPTNLCELDGVCKVGACVGVPNNCGSSPLNECNQVTCNPSTGDCVGTPDSNKDGNPCLYTGDLCMTNKACLSGQCVGGTPTDCSLLDVQCQVGVCDTTTGLCDPMAAPVGTSCTSGIQECQTGACNVAGTCTASKSPDGSACNDHDACTQGDTCTAGACAGAAIAGCARYFFEGFETCPDGWTLAGDWQCGTPTNMSPVTPYDGQGVLATQLDGVYHDNQTYPLCYADSPPIDLTKATNPQLSFWAWEWTYNDDGCNLKISTDGGTTFQSVTAVSPPYGATVFGQMAWGGNFSAQGWQPYSADLTPWIGNSVILRYDFASDLTNVAPGFYVDDIVIAEPLESPLYITTPTTLADGYALKDYSATLTKIGGTSASKWMITGGVNYSGWLTIDMNTGVLSGTPPLTATGAVTVTVEVQEPTLPSNYDVQTFTFYIQPNTYYTGFEGTCPDGWTLTGDWKCGAPMTVGPATAYDGTQCIGTGMGKNYSANDTYAGTTATSPPISFAGVLSPTLTFEMWVDTEGGTYDGANLEISTDGGSTFQVVTTVTPVYPLTIAGQPAWGGHLYQQFGWQLVQADLSAYTGLTVLLRFGFQSSSTTNGAGFFVDDFLVQ
jgi:hypothetical protein